MTHPILWAVQYSCRITFVKAFSWITKSMYYTRCYKLMQCVFAEISVSHVLSFFLMYTMHNKFSDCFVWFSPSTSYLKVRKGTKIRNWYNQVPHLTQDTNGKVTDSQLDTTNQSQEVSPIPAGNHNAHINRRAQRHSKHKTEKTQKIHKRRTALERSVKYLNQFNGAPTSPLVQMWIKIHKCFVCIKYPELINVSSPKTYKTKYKKKKQQR